MTDIVVKHAELSEKDGRQIYVVTVESEGPEGSEMKNCIVHMMDSDIFETRAADYGIDTAEPGAWDQLFDLVITNTYVPHPPVAPMSDPDHLLIAPSVEHARDAKLRRIRKARGTNRLLGEIGTSEAQGQLDDATRLAHSGTEDPLEFIKRTAPMSAEHIAVKQEHTRRRRAVIRAARMGRNPTEMTDGDAEPMRAMKKVPDRESVEALATRLLGPPVIESHLPPRAGLPSKDIVPPR